MKLRNVEKWTKGKAELPALLSAFLVVNTEKFLSVIYHFSENRKLSQAMTINGIKDWEDQYRNWITHSDELLSVISKINQHDQIISQDKMPFFRDMVKADDSVDFNLSETCSFIKTELLDDFDIPDTEIEEDENQLIIKCEPLIQSLQFIFFTKIFMPCVLIYRTTPFILLRSSFDGDIESLRKLLTLDNNLQRVPEVMSIWEEESRFTNSPRYQSLVKALSESVVSKITIKNIKITFATLIEHSFKLASSPISRTTIRELFDSYAIDCNNEMIDTDLPESEEAFSRAINRENKRWKESLFPSDHQI